MNPGFPQRTVRLLAAALLVSAVALPVFRVVWVGPERESLAMRRTELERRRGEIGAARRAAGLLPAIEADVERLRRRAAGLRRTLPERRDAPGVLRGLQGIAGEAGLTVEAVSLDAVRIGDRFEEWPVRLELTGGFHELAAFLHEVGRLPWIVTIGRLSIRALPPDGQTATIAVTCTATTYVMRESAAEPDPRPEEGRPADGA